jgi:branched-chain amino acid transport system permease protein
MDVVIINILNGISYGVLLFLIASGLSLILGLMGIVNLAHGIIFVLGGFAGLTVANLTGSFVLAVLAGALMSGLAGLIIERAFLRHLYKQDLEQVLVTFGFVFILANLIQWIWGAYPRSAFVPSYFDGSAPILGFHFPIHRFAVIAIGAALAVGLWWLQDKTRIGAIIRASMDDKEMAGGLGINLQPITIGAFFLGSALAGAGCVIGVQLLGSIAHYDGVSMLLLAIAVCIIGGVGSVQGALVGALLIGLIDSFGRIYFPVLAPWTMYIVMIVILIIRPTGLLGRKL